jgi:hypothetical protein
LLVFYTTILENKVNQFSCCSLSLQPTSTSTACRIYTMHCVGYAPGFPSPAMPSKFMRRCAALHMRPPFPHRGHLGGGWIPALPGHANKLCPLRVSAPADMILSEYKEPAKGEDGTPWVFNVSTWKIFGLFFKCVVTVACSATLIFMCHLGITHYHSVSYIQAVFRCFIMRLSHLIIMQYVYRFFNFYL